MEVHVRPYSIKKEDYEEKSANSMCSRIEGSLIGEVTYFTSHTFSMTLLPFAEKAGVSLIIFIFSLIHLHSK